MRENSGPYELDEIRDWFAGRLPAGWFAAPPEVLADREEILVVGTLPVAGTEAEATTASRAAAEAARINAFREATRAQRMRIADEAEYHFRRKVSWGAVCGGTRRYFTSLSLPVMTRLRIAERRVLDTLVHAGVARSRSEALAWCVRLVAAKQNEWIEELRQVTADVERVRARGPRVF